MKRIQNRQDFQVNGSPGAVMGNIGSSINQHTTVPSKKTEIHPICLLYLAANPATTSQLRLDKEIKIIDSALRAPGLQEHFKLEQCWAASERDIQESLLRYQPDIVHFSGHGSSTGRLVLERDPDLPGRTGSRPGLDLEADDKAVLGLARLFGSARGRIRCAVLNACHSETSARALAEQIDCVVGMSTAVEDQAAIRFSWAFYHGLASGLSVKNAFDLATAQLLLGGFNTESAPKLWSTRVDPREIKFSTHSSS
jgi:CHAT domain